MGDALSMDSRPVRIRTTQLDHADTPGAAEPEAAEQPLSKKAIVTVRAVIAGMLLSILVDVWIEWAELIMDGHQGHTALANTAIPVGPFSVLFAITGLNLLVRAILPTLAFTGSEMLTIYVMMATSCVLASSGQMQFLVPTITAVWHYATKDNGWAALFQPYIPHWLAQTDPKVLAGFYGGRTSVPYSRWLPQIAAWSGFMVALAGASFCTVSILRRQWVDREQLSFPTVQLPLALVQEKTPILRSPIFWLGFVIPFSISVLNTFALNIPGVPLLNLRANPLFQNIYFPPPWTIMSSVQFSLYPFVIGIAYFAPLDVTFSCWFFFIVTLVEHILGSALGFDATVVQSNRAAFPYIGYQGAGAFLGLALVSLFASRKYLTEVYRKAIGTNPALDDSGEPMSYRAAFIGLVVSLAAMTVFCVVAGMNALVAFVVIIMGLLYMLSATRVRAETGDAWLGGPDIDVNTLVTRTLTGNMLDAHDLTILSFLRPILTNSDLRCITMPHQLEAMKMGQAAGVNLRSLAKAIAIATLFGLIVTFCICLTFWHKYGAEVGTDLWRTGQGRVPFDNLADLLRNKPTPDLPGIGGVIFGFAVTALLCSLRTQFLWWPLHPIGYVIANTYTIQQTWMPFFVAWLLKMLVIRYGGAKTYRATQPFFLGVIAGDLIGGGFFTAFGAFTGINVYPMNW
jgi:hypothetical protein